MVILLQSAATLVLIVARDAGGGFHQAGRA
jgi:hypothetical protein